MLLHLDSKEPSKLSQIVMNNLYKELKVAIILVAIICLVTTSIQIFISGKLTWHILGEQILYNLYYGIPLSLINSKLFEALNNYLPWESQSRKRAIAGIVGSISITMLTLIILNFILWVFLKGNDISALWIRENRNFYIIALLITVLVSISMHAIGFFYEVQREKLVSQKLRKEKLSTELNALRAHIDPHFLFNSFNVLSGLIEEDKNKAQDFLEGLSKIYRYILEQRHEDTSTIEDELAFAKKYLTLHRMRFENSILLHTDIDDSLLDKKIPSLSLQLLLENAIKHNAFDTNNPLSISISADADLLSVSNNRKVRKKVNGSNKMGLKNIKDRYKLMSQKDIQIISEEDQFTVQLPLI